MKVHCPQCGTESEIPDAAHYKVLLCPKCGASFHAVTETTQQISRAILGESVKLLEKKPR